MATRRNRKRLVSGVSVDVSGSLGAAWFQQLATMFDECLDCAKKYGDDIRWYMGGCRSVTDIKTLVDPNLLRGVAGCAQSYHSLHSQLIPGERLTDKRLAGLCGYYIMPLAAHHVVRMAITGVLSEPDALCEPLRLPVNRPGDDEQGLRAYWTDDVLRILLKLYTRSFSCRSSDDWLAAKDNAAACRLLANLATKEKKSLSTSVTAENEERSVRIRLPKRAKKVLVAMLQLQVFDFDSCKTTPEIVKQVTDDPGAPESYKEVVSSLRKRGLVCTQHGRGNGCWLTPKGRAEAERLKCLIIHTSPTGSHRLPSDSPPITP